VEPFLEGLKESADRTYVCHRRGEKNSNGTVKPVAVESTMRPRRRTALGVAAAVLAVLPDKAKQMGAGPVWTGKGAAAVYKHLKAASASPVVAALGVSSQSRPIGSLPEEPATSAMPATPAPSAKSVWASAACTPVARVTKPEPAGSFLTGAEDSCVDGSNGRSDDAKRAHPQERADVEMVPVGDVDASSDAVALLLGPQGSKRAGTLEAPLMEEVPETKRARTTCSTLLASSTGVTSSISRGAVAGHGRGPREGVQTPSEKPASTSSVQSSPGGLRPPLCRETGQTSGDRGLVADAEKAQGTPRLEVEGEEGASVAVEAHAVDTNHTQPRRNPEAATLVAAQGRPSSSRKALEIAEMAEEVAVGKPDQSGARQAREELAMPADTAAADSPPAIVHLRLAQEGGATTLGGEASCPPAASGIEKSKRNADCGEGKVAGSNGELVDELHEWLASVGLEKYAGLLQQQQVSMSNISSVTLDDLRKLPIYAVGPRRKLINAIDSLTARLE
ncbi:hypothetical protein CYMTET_30171, partial [Cymbomonas tetramitiformis]